MRGLASLPLSLITYILFNPSLTLAESDNVDCLIHRDDAACNEPLRAVTTLEEGKYYVAKVPCLDCPIVKTEGPPTNRKHYNVDGVESELFYNVSLSNDAHSLLLNHHRIFPSLDRSNSGEPPAIYAGQVPPTFSWANLSTTSECIDEVRGSLLACIDPVLSIVALDYDYGSQQLEMDNETVLEENEEWVEWEITFDAIGGKDGYLVDPMWTFNNSKQSMLQVRLRGKEVSRSTPNPNSQAGDLFGGSISEEEEIVYDLEITDVSFVPRSYTFPDPPKLGFWGHVKHFFGVDPSPPAGHTIYLQEEWGSWGREGSLKNELGKIIYGWWWDLIFIIVGSVVGGLIVLYGLYRLFLVILEQRRLAQWGGMDEVWRRIRENGTEEEELLGDEYRDDPDEGSSSRYHDEPTVVNKPLPAKPLPEKPLPDVPLIDDI